MTNEKMEQRLAAALEKTAPDDVNGVLSRCEERKGTVIPMTTKKTTKRKWTSLIAACLAVMLLGGGGLFYQRANAVASVVSLDVNPSIELKVNRSEKVLVCTPLNEDAKAILADMGSGADLKGAKLDVAVNAIVGSLVRNGYLDSISSAIMISVEDKDTARAEKLQREPDEHRGRRFADKRIEGIRPDADADAGRGTYAAGAGKQHFHRKGGAGEPRACTEPCPEV